MSITASVSPSGTSSPQKNCSICNPSKPAKYRCPGCSARTCSLECNRRHKTLTLCTGRRDPAAFLRRHELATPAAFDRDYNFIAGIERGREVAERVVEEMMAGGTMTMKQDVGVVDEVAMLKRSRRQQHQQRARVRAGEALAAAQRERGVRVKKAPVGLSRSKRNETRWLKKQEAIEWTVEYICFEGHNEASGSAECCPSTTKHPSVHEKARVNETWEKLRRSEQRGDSSSYSSHRHRYRYYLYLPDAKVPSTAGGGSGSGGGSKALLDLGNGRRQLQEVLRGRMVEEYPTFYVFDEEAKNVGVEVGGRIEAGESVFAVVERLNGLNEDGDGEGNGKGNPGAMEGTGNEKRNADEVVTKEEEKARASKKRKRKMKRPAREQEGKEEGERQEADEEAKREDEEREENP